ncbi:cyanate transporter [Brucella suis 63/252]|uniref:CynX/NimT family MFS transporter n=1 Tax=Brucella TaxID=234 RepID=UPI0002CE88FD|nr:CynX/NimT family MFS transporter [Brucella suis]ENR16396.1 cyanate transporter [Brucella suis 63/252]KEY00038.1 MFS transporter [Brucella inopinata BO1]
MSHASALPLDGPAGDDILVRSQPPLTDAEADSVPAPDAQRPPSKALRILLGASLVLIAANLRPVFSSVSVLLPEIIQATGMSSVSAGVLTTLPVVCLGAFAPFAPRLAQRFGAERTLLFVLIVLTVGTAIRGLGTQSFLYMGAALAGAAIAVGNVLLPGVVKRDFPKTAAIMTGLYTMALCAGAASAAGFTIPIKNMLGGSWNLALAFWAVPAALVFVLWLPQALRAKHHVAHSGFKVAGLWRDRLAWQVTLFMGLQSSTAYIVFGWLAPILRERGMSAGTAGGLVSFSIMAQVITCLLISSIAVRQKNQSFINVFLCGCAVLALIGFLYLPGWAFLPLAIIQGIGQGGLIAAAMMVIVLRSPDSHTAAHLSGMAQCVGYILAAIGPLLVGMIHSATGSFAACGVLFVLLGLGASINGWGAGRAGHVGVQVSKDSA